MKIIVLHGDNASGSYDQLQKLIKIAKKSNWEILNIDTKKSISEQLSLVGLFQVDRLLIIDKPNLLTKNNLEWITNNYKNIIGTLVIYNQSSLSKTYLNQLPKEKDVKEFTLPKLVWSLLDSIYPNNSKKALKLLHNVCEKENIEFVFALISRHIRDLYWIKVEKESLDLPPWRKSKLKSQSDKFSSALIKELVKSLANIDIKVKTSNANLLDELDYLIASKLE